MKPYKALKYFNDFLDSEDFENYVQNVYWERTFNEDKVFDLVVEKAIEDMLYLEDLEEHTNEIYDMIIEAYNATEKGVIVKVLNLKGVNVVRYKVNKINGQSVFTYAEDENGSTLNKKELLLLNEKYAKMAEEIFNTEQELKLNY